MKTIRSLLVCAIFTGLLSCIPSAETKFDSNEPTKADIKDGATSDRKTKGAVKKISFAKQVKPILERKCLGCHHDQSNFTGLTFHAREEILEASSESRPILVPGQAKKSTLYIVTTLPSYFIEAMPAGKHQLTEEEQAVLYQWIEEGAVWPATIRLRPSSDAEVIVNGLL